VQWLDSHGGSSLAIPWHGVGYHSRAAILAKINHGTHT